MALVASVETQTEAETLLLTFKSPGKRKYFEDDISNSSFTDASPPKRTKCTLPQVFESRTSVGDAKTDEQDEEGKQTELVFVFESTPEKYRSRAIDYQAKANSTEHVFESTPVKCMPGAIDCQANANSTGVKADEQDEEEKHTDELGFVFESTPEQYRSRAIDYQAKANSTEHKHTDELVFVFESTPEQYRSRAIDYQANANSTEHVFESTPVKCMPGAIDWQANANSTGVKADEHVFDSTPVKCMHGAIDCQANANSTGVKADEHVFESTPVKCMPGAIDCQANANSTGVKADEQDEEEKHTDGLVFAEEDKEEEQLGSFCTPLSTWGFSDTEEDEAEEQPGSFCVPPLPWGVIKIVKLSDNEEDEAEEQQVSLCAPPLPLGVVKKRVQFNLDQADRSNDKENDFDSTIWALRQIDSTDAATKKHKADEAAEEQQVSLCAPPLPLGVVKKRVQFNLDQADRSNDKENDFDSTIWALRQIDSTDAATKKHKADEAAAAAAQQRLGLDTQDCALVLCTLQAYSDNGHCDDSDNEFPSGDDTETNAAATDDDGDPQNRFRDEAGFREYFTNKTLAMRSLLARYTTVRDKSAIISGPRFHLPLVVPNETIPTFFFQMFTYDCFGVKGDRHVVPIAGSVWAIEDILSEPLNMLTNNYEVAKAELKAVQVRLNVAAAAVIAQAKCELHPTETALNVVYHYLRTRVRALTADGGDTNGELTRGSIDKILTVMIEHYGMNENSVLCDGGANYNVFVAHAAQRTGCKAWGVEYVPVRTFVAASQFLRALNSDRGKMKNPRVAYVPCDLYLLRSLVNTTIVYLFDEAFPPSLFEHNIKVAASTQSVKHIISFKASKNRSLHQVFEDYGFKQGKKVPVNKTGSNEGNTAYIYTRETMVDVSWPETGAAPVTDEHLLTQYLNPAWGGCFETRLDMYGRIKLTTEQGLDDEKQQRKQESTRKTKSNVSCAWRIWVQCAQRCKTCTLRFKHWDEDVEERGSAIHGRGLYATKVIPAHTFVVGYTGNVSTSTHYSLEERRYIAEVGPKHFIDATQATGPHKYVNHSCRPNSRLLRWMNPQKVKELSIHSLRQLEPNEEITVDYGKVFKKHFATCLCPQCSTARPVVLCLGMVFCETGSIDVVQLVQDNTFTPLEGRDTARCLAMEERSKVDVYTLDTRSPDKMRVERHITTNFSSRRLVSGITALIKTPIQQICMDYFWAPQSWVHDQWAPLISQHLAGFAPLLSPNGCVYFPFLIDVLKLLIEHESTWEQLYDISFARGDNEEEMSSHLLWFGTQGIPANTLRNVYQKELDQEKRYCITTYAQAKGLSKSRSALSKSLVGMQSRIEAIRFIRLGKRPPGKHRAA
jgi:hypothetical protein